MIKINNIAVKRVFTFSIGACQEYFEWEEGSNYCKLISYAVDEKDIWKDKFGKETYAQIIMRGLGVKFKP